jgi:methylmalonyl-CoA mutase N-terminal domain/subunit
MPPTPKRGKSGQKVLRQKKGPVRRANAPLRARKSRPKKSPASRETPPALHDARAIRRLAAEALRWRETTLKATLEKMPQRKPEFATDSGVPIPDILTPADLPRHDYERIGFPGEFPYTRGVQPSVYRGRLWTMRQFAGFGTPEDTNRRFKYLLEHGVTGLSTAFDMPALMGYDCDHPMSLGEVGKEGVAVSSLKDFEVLFDGIPLDRVTTSMTINAPAIVAMAMYIAVAEKQGVSQEKLGGTIQNDILKEYIAQKEWIIPPRPAVRLVVDTIEYATKHLPKWNMVSISGYHIREAGATAVQELAFTLADGLGYVEECVKRGMEVDVFAPRLSFFWDVHNDFFEEVAKFRAARRLWANLMRDRFGAKDPRSMMLRTHAQTAGVSLTAQQPYNNVVRTSLQALAAVLGGTQSLHTNSLDETYALPTEEAATLALRTQQIIGFESGVDRVVDPLAGSYYVEYLTDEMEKRALAYIRRIDELGGIVRAVEEGFPQKEIADSAYRFQREVEKGERTIVGINRFTSRESASIKVLKIEDHVAKAQVERLAEVKAGRNAEAVRQSLAAVERAARGTENLMPAVIAAVKTYATLGEICDVLRKVFGVYREAGQF